MRTIVIAVAGLLVMAGIGAATIALIPTNDTAPLDPIRVKIPDEVRPAAPAPNPPPPLAPPPVDSRGVPPPPPPVAHTPPGGGGYGDDDLDDDADDWDDGDDGDDD